MSIQQRRWVESGGVEELDSRQVALLKLVQAQVETYYRDLYGTRPCYAYPLNLSRLAKMCKRSGESVLGAIRILAHSVAQGEERPILRYSRVRSRRNRMHRPYCIYLSSNLRKPHSGPPEACGKRSEAIARDESTDLPTASGDDAPWPPGGEAPKRARSHKG